jgi:hypothetical protein
MSFDASPDQPAKESPVRPVKKSNNTWISVVVAVFFVLVTIGLGYWKLSKVPGGLGVVLGGKPVDAPKVTWPDGWTVHPSETKMGGLLSETQAVFVQHGTQMAYLLANVQTQEDSTSLETVMKIFIKGEQVTTMFKGITMDVSPPVNTTWMGQPALEFDVTLHEKNGPVHQRAALVRGTKHVVCNLTYVVSASNFDTLLPAYNATKEHFACP